MNKYRLFLLGGLIVVFLFGCTPRGSLKAIPLPEVGVTLWEAGDYAQTLTPEKAACYVCPTLSLEEQYNALPWEKDSRHWGNLYTHSVCWADVTLLETRDCARYKEDGTLYELLTLARCKVNDVVLQCEQCRLLPGDEVTLVLNNSMHVPAGNVPALKENGRYLVPVEDLSQMQTPSGWEYYRGYAQYRAVCDDWFLMEIIGRGNRNPKVDTKAMGNFIGLDQVDGCEDYLEWGTKNG